MSSRPSRFTAVVGDATRAVEVVALGEGRYQVSVDGTVSTVDGRRTGAAGFSLLIDHALTDVSVVMRGDTYLVDVGGRVHRVQLLDARRARTAAAPGAGEREVRAAMPGKIVAVLVEAGATVTRGQGLLVIEAMKMENEVTAPRDGTVQEIRVQSGQTVEAGELLAVIE
ncbi:MAG: biotin/lipoyl-binding protein [Deltaproteobacteria bacterium]|nr:MAG: biotin/lipoyl-binding protein [Deltaproteobacteria bacterium]